MKITYEQLRAIMPYAAKSKLLEFIDPINLALEKYDINNRLRICAFISQIAHESGSLNYTKEIASGAAYEGRKDLGNINEGDGVKFKGRGLIQVTGLANYNIVGKALGLDLFTHPELLEKPLNAAMSAAWWWHNKGLNAWADKGDMIKITKIINGGTNGLKDRLDFYNTSLKVIL